MVGSVDVKFPIRLEKLVLSHSQFSSYEPELFPGLIYRMVKPRIVLLIFVSGKVVLTGAKHRKGLLNNFIANFLSEINSAQNNSGEPFIFSEIDDAFQQIFPILKGFQKRT